MFVSLTGYREDDFEAYLFMSTDFGETWKSIVNNMPSESINVIREDPTDRDILYVGTELGAYCSIDKGKTWHSLCKTLPTCAVHDLALHAGTGDLVAGTHGRSVFCSPCKGDSEDEAGDGEVALSMKLSKLSRRLHRWGSIIALLPIMIVSGVVLQSEKVSP